MNITEKAAYLKGLMEGMNYDTATNEGKLFAAIADLLEDITLTVADLDDEVATLGEYVDELDEDLGAVEEDLYGDECCCDDDCDCCCDDDDCDCDCCEEECDCCDGECVELECPECGEPIVVACEDLVGLETIACPSCNKSFEISVDVDEDEE